MFWPLRIVFVGGLLVVLGAGEGARAQEDIGGFEFAFRAAPQMPAPDLGPTQAAFHPLAFDCIENDGPVWPAGSDALAGVSGMVVQGSYYCTLEQLDPGVTNGARGWQMGFTATGCDAAILAVTTTQTDIGPGTIEDCEGGPGRGGGFDATELTSGPDNEGATHAIVLAMNGGTTLDPTGSNTPPAIGVEVNPLTVLRFLIEYRIPDTLGDSCDVILQCVDGLQGRGQPIDKKVTQNGNSVVPQTVEKIVTVTAFSEQLAGDCNDDGVLEISDTICLLGFLFASTPPMLPCGPTAGNAGNLAVFDVNGDGSIDLSDATYKLAFLFNGGPPPVQGAECFYTADCPDKNAGCL